ncbi:MAG: GAF domain-containing sensor histidine kinase [Chloroflexota bacterium]
MTTEAHLQWMERLLQACRELSASLELQPFLQSAITLASELTGSEAASVLVFDESVGQLRFVATPWSQRKALTGLTVPVNGSAAGWVFSNGERLVVHDAATDPRHFKGADQAADFVTRSILAVPITYKGRILGVFEAVNKADRTHYTGEDVTILETLASQSALAIENDRLERKQHSTRDRVASLDRMKNEFIAIASHELRTPLGLILGHATFLREQVDKGAYAQLDTIIRNAIKLKDIIESMSDVDNYQQGKSVVRRQPVSMAFLVKDVVKSFQAEARSKGRDLRMDIAAEDLMVDGDANKITIALSSLLKNALAFTDRGGHVFVLAEKVTGYVKVSVIDDGIGIPAKDLAHIFERFYQVETHLTRSHGGMGLGLSVAKTMIEMHGGRIWVESKEGKGSIFSFLLPLDTRKSDAPPGPFLT